MKKETSEQRFEYQNVFVDAWFKDYNNIRKFSVDIVEYKSFTNMAFIDASNTLSNMKIVRDKILDSELNDVTKEKIDILTNTIDFYLNKCIEAGYNPHKEKNNHAQLSFMLELYPKLPQFN